jgi:hypothetical protein
VKVKTTVLTQDVSDEKGCQEREEKENGHARSARESFGA